jgi:hypothetical protein
MEGIFLKVIIVHHRCQDRERHQRIVLFSHRPTAVSPYLRGSSQKINKMTDKLMPTNII